MSISFLDAEFEMQKDKGSQKYLSLSDLPEDLSPGPYEESKKDLSPFSRKSSSKSPRRNSWPRINITSKENFKSILLKKFSQNNPTNWAASIRKTFSLNEIPKVSSQKQKQQFGDASGKPKLSKGRNFRRKISFNQVESCTTIENRNSDNWVTEHLKSSLKAPLQILRSNRRHDSDASTIASIQFSNQDSVCQSLNELAGFDSNCVTPVHKTGSLKTAKSILKVSRGKEEPTSLWDNQLDGGALLEAKKAVKFS